MAGSTLLQQIKKEMIPYIMKDKLVDEKNSENIGKGAYGAISKIKYCGTPCAAKEIHPILLENIGREELERTKATYLHECRQCCTLRHPNIVQFLGLYYPPSTSRSGRGAKLPVIVMELIPIKNIFQDLVKY